MPPPVVSLIGKADCGKTTLLEQLIPSLRQRGVRVGTIKHHVHAFEMDRPGKDSWRHKQAGARIVALSSPSGVGIIRDTDHDAAPATLACRYFEDVDLVITEGYKDAATPKIEVFRSSVHPEPLPDGHPGLIASVSNIPIHQPLPCFNFDDCDQLADFLIAVVLQPAQSATAAGAATVSVTVNGKPLPLNSFVTSMISRTVTGMISALRGGDKGGDIVLSIKPAGKPADVTDNAD